MIILDRQFYARDTLIVAGELLGKLLVHEVNGTILSGKIVETEAYRAEDDPASHAYKGKTVRNRPMFGPVGYSYVYFVYCNHFCFNVVAKGRDQEAGAVLIRAVEPIEGIDYMCKHRSLKDIVMLTNGPGKLTQAFSISRRHNDYDLTKRGTLYLAFMNGAIEKSASVRTTGRIGIRIATENQWRFYCANNRWISR